MFRDGHLDRGVGVECARRDRRRTIVAPPKDRLILPGITYGAAWDFAREAGIPFEIRPVTKAEALAADEMWLTSSTKEVLADHDRSTASLSPAANRARCSGRCTRYSRRTNAARSDRVRTQPAGCVVPNRP